MVPVPNSVPNSNSSRNHRFALSLIRLRGSPEEIARGAAIGAFIAFTPTLGIQMILAAAVATWLGASRPAALLPVWISNPATAFPLYAFTYSVGKRFLPGPSAEAAAPRLAVALEQAGEAPLWRLDLYLAALSEVGWEVFGVLLVGGFVAGVVAAGLCYIGVVKLVRDGRHRLHDLELRRRAAGPSR
jgi:uncharacterized protein (DUF2062 family)